MNLITRINTILKIINTTIIIIFLVVCASLAVQVLNLNPFVGLYAVLSGSMSPTIPTGSLIAVVPTNNYDLGNIVTVRQENTKTTMTHRIVDVKENEGKIQYSTKGDANDFQDFNTINKDKIIGKVVFWLPLMGYLVSYAKSQAGFLVMIIIPAVAIIIMELISIKKELVRILNKNEN